MNMIILPPLTLSQKGSTLVILTIILVGLGVLIFAGFQVVPIVSQYREHQIFKETVDTRIQSLAVVTLPDTQNTLIEEIGTMLDTMKAQYEPNYIQVTAEKHAQKLLVQVWYSKPHTSLVFANPRKFYMQSEKIGIPITLAPTPTPPPIPIEPTKTPMKLAKVPSATPVPKATPIPIPTITVIRAKPAKHVTDATFAREVLKSPIPVMVNFWAPWCGYCRRAIPAVDEASSRFDGQIKIVKVNIDKNKNTASRYNVRGVPDFVFFHNGEIIGRRSGFSSKQALLGIIKQYLRRIG